MSSIDKATFERIIADPSAAYELPESVLKDKRLSLDQKIAVLQQWEFDARELQVAEEENMAGDAKPTQLHQVLLALQEIT